MNRPDIEGLRSWAAIETPCSCEWVVDLCDYIEQLEAERDALRTIGNGLRDDLNRCLAKPHHKGWVSEPTDHWHDGATT